LLPAASPCLKSAAPFAHRSQVRTPDVRPAESDKEGTAAYAQTGGRTRRAEHPSHGFEAPRACTSAVQPDESGSREEARGDAFSVTHLGVEDVEGMREVGGWGGMQTGMGRGSFGEAREAPACSGDDDGDDEWETLVKANKLYKDEHTFNFTLHSYWLLTEDEISPDRIPVFRRWVSLVNLALASCK